MARKEPLYPHVPKSRRTTEKLETVEDNVWVYVKVGTTEVRGRKVPSGIQIQQVSPTYDRGDFDKAVKLIEEKLKPCERAEALRRFPPAKKGRVRLLERYSLPEGGFVQVTKLGRNYTFTRGYSSFTQAPDVQLGLTKDEAMRLLADALRASVLEIEE